MSFGEFRNTEHELYNFQTRVGVAGGLVMIAFLILMARFFYLKVIKHDY